MIVIPITPVPKPRMTRADRWKERPATTKYWRYKDALKAEVRGELEPRFMVTFRIPMPKSWSKKKRAEMLGKPHQQRPDVDNLAKAFMDALCKEDGYVYDIRARKFWADCGSIELEESGVTG